jgi:hypothetical protein
MVLVSSSNLLLGVTANQKQSENRLLEIFKAGNQENDE